MASFQGYPRLASVASAALCGLLLGLGPAVIPDETTNATEAVERDRASEHLIERTTNDVRDAVSHAIASAKDAASRNFGIDRLTNTAESCEWEPLADDEALPAHAVILIHGLDEVGGIWSDVAPRLRDEGFDVLRFRYPNDGRVAISADLLTSWMVGLNARGVRCADLVCHSMGGLVAYEMLTREGLYGGVASGHADLPSVRRLVTVGTPFHGSPFIPLRGVMEAREQIAGIFDGEGEFTDRALRFLADGTGEAGEDLRPGSDFLAALHARPIPQGVRITTVIGRIETDAVQNGRASVTRRLAGLLGEARANALLSYTNGLSSTLGDGAVPYRSAHLDGVDDVVYVQADHRSMICRIDLPEFARNAAGLPKGSPPAIAPIVERLTEECGCEID